MILIKGGTIVTADHMERADVVIEAGRIAAVLPEGQAFDRQAFERLAVDGRRLGMDMQA